MVSIGGISRSETKRRRAILPVLDAQHPGAQPLKSHNRDCWLRRCSILRCFWKTVIALILPLLAVTSGAQSEEREATHKEIRIAYLYNFARFTEWPQIGPASDFHLCSLDADMARALSALAGRTVGSAPIISSYVSGKDITDCELLYLPDGSAFPKELPSTTLTVGEKGSDAAITFVEVQGTVRFRLRLSAFGALKPSAKLRQIALETEP